MKQQVWAVQRRGYEDETWLFMNKEIAVAWYHNYRHYLRSEVSEVVDEDNESVYYYDSFGNYIAVELERLDINVEDTL